MLTRLFGDFEFMFWVILVSVVYLFVISPLVRHLWRTRPGGTTRGMVKEVRDLFGHGDNGFLAMSLPQSIWDGAKAWHPAFARPFSVGAEVRYERRRSRFTPRAVVEKTYRRHGVPMVRLWNGSSRFSRPLHEINFAV
ncbi:MAG: hypothetical protein AAB655_01280 [Patescibacteria group bacterium]